MIHTRSNAAILLFPFSAGICFVFSGSGAYFPITKLPPTTRHVIRSGFFFDVGVKKEATALSVRDFQYMAV